jgi:hypothetical protein
MFLRQRQISTAERAGHWNIVAHAPEGSGRATDQEVPDGQPFIVQKQHSRVRAAAVPVSGGSGHAGLASATAACMEASVVRQPRAPRTHLASNAGSRDRLNAYCPLVDAFPAGSNLHVGLTIAAFALEAAGLVLIVSDAARARRVEFGQLSIPRRFVKWIGDGVEMARITHAAAQLRGTAAATASASGSVTVSSDETDIERVERRVDELTQRLERQQDEMTAHVDSLRTELRDGVAELHSRLGAFGDEQKRLRRHELNLQVLGSRLFIAGAALSGAANLVA